MGYFGKIGWNHECVFLDEDKTNEHVERESEPGMTNRDIKIVNLHIGLPKKMKYGNDKIMETGICKEQVEEAFLTKEGFIGDGVGDLRYHGGPDRAVCVYPYEHYLLWEKEFQISLPSSSFGENLCVTNMLENDVYIGSVFRLGDAIIQITQGRVPCSKITQRTNVNALLKRFVETCFTGYLCRVLQEGTVRKDSTITLLEPHPKQVSVLFSNQIYYHKKKDVEGIRKVVEVPELAKEWREELTGRLEKLTSS